ncbi:MAG: M20/M25/M40 family metallo-hydrolase [Spirochaetia bacterium]
MSETIIANLVMISEIPAPTFHEQERMEFMVNRLTESGLQYCSTDEVGNALGILPGTSGEKNILIVAHLDTLFDDSVDHTITVQSDRVIGPGIGDDGVGLAVIASIPGILEKLAIQLKSNLILMGSARSLGKGDIGGLRFFLSHTNVPIDTGICVEGVELGRLSYSSIGMMRCEITCIIPEEYDWTRFGASGAVTTINKVINRILELPIPKQPQTGILLGSVEGGTSFNTIATQAVLKFEIRSESEDMVRQLAYIIESITEEISALTNAEVKFHVIATRKPGGIRFTHPLVERTREVLKVMGIKHRIQPSTSELAAFIAHNIPAVTLGITTGENMDKLNESIRIEPMYRGITQLLGVIHAIDRGYCDESE